LVNISDVAVDPAASTAKATASSVEYVDAINQPQIGREDDEKLDTSQCSCDKGTAAPEVASKSAPEVNQKTISIESNRYKVITITFPDDLEAKTTLQEKSVTQDAGKPETEADGSSESGIDDVAVEKASSSPSKEKLSKKKSEEVPSKSDEKKSKRPSKDSKRSKRDTKRDSGGSKKSKSRKQGRKDGNKKESRDGAVKQ